LIAILRHRDFRHLFLAQMVALIGTGLATVALALLAYDLAGPKAGAVLGTALAIKMTVYVTLAPLSAAIIPPATRKVVLVALDVVRAAVALTLPFVRDVWQVYVLIAVLQSASACFTPLFQSLIPEMLTDERDYTRALSLSRFSYDLESLLSPAIAAALLTVTSFHGLFAGTSICFVASALLVVTTAFPVSVAGHASGRPYARALRGLRTFARTPRLRALVALNLCAAAGGAMVFVNTVVVVRSALHGGEREVAWALAAFGSGSMLVALSLPRILDRVPDRRVMLAAAVAMVAALTATSGLWAFSGSVLGWSTLSPSWVMLGMAYAGLVTPGGRLLRRSAHAGDLPQLFAAQFSLSHLCWLLTYPLAGWVGATWGLEVALFALTVVAGVGAVTAWRAWPAADPQEIEHAHPDLPADHPHLVDHAPTREGAHLHNFVIDDLHARWPER
jgi:MFS family permease